MEDFMPNSRFFEYWPIEGREEESPYFYLYQALRFVPDYGGTHALWSLFGDVLGLSFWAWFDEYGEPALCTYEPIAVDFVHNPIEVEAARERGAAIVFVDAGADLNSLMRDFIQVIEELGVVTEGRLWHRPEPRHDDEADKTRKRRQRPTNDAERRERAYQLGTRFTLERVPSVKRLRNALKVHELEQRGMEAEEIAKELGLDTYKAGEEKKGRREYVESIRRCRLDALSIMKGLQAGKFPLLND